MVGTVWLAFCVSWKERSEGWYAAAALVSWGGNCSSTCRVNGCWKTAGLAKVLLLQHTVTCAGGRDQHRTFAALAFGVAVDQGIGIQPSHCNDIACVGYVLRPVRV